jgi:predicted ATPase
MVADGLGLNETARAALLAAARPDLLDRPEPSARRPSLPVPLTRLVGREHDVARLSGMVCDNSIRMLTLTGPGGSGKTRLALAVADGVAPAFPDGVVFVDLAPLQDPRLVLPAMAQALGVREMPARSLGEVLFTHLQGTCLLLVLDNMEHLLDAGPAIADLLTIASRMTVLATSRVRLGLRGEWEYPVNPLAVPAEAPGSGRDLSLEEIAANPAVMVFMERAHAVKPGFTLIEATMRDVAAICVRLDGLPLALELAATWMKLLSPAMVLGRLTEGTLTLEGGARDLPERQLTMHATIAWSHTLLALQEQIVFRRLAVFVGGWTLPAAEAVAQGDDVGDVLASLRVLVDHSLVTQREERDGQTRFAMLETLREFALEQLGVSGESDTIRLRHAHWYLDLLGGMRVEVKDVWHYGPALATIDAEHGNIRAALEWLQATSSERPMGRLIVGLAGFWFTRGHHTELRRWITAAVAAEDLEPEVRFTAIEKASDLARLSGDHVRALELAEQLLTLAQHHGDRQRIAQALHLMSSAANYQGDHERARVLAAESVRRYQEEGDAPGLGRALLRLGIEVYLHGDVHGAESLFADALRVAEANRDLRVQTYCLLNLGIAAFALGQTERAVMRYRNSLNLCWDAGDKWGVSLLLVLLGAIAEQEGEFARAARLGGAAEALGEASGMPLQPYIGAIHERSMAAVRLFFSESEVSQAWQLGRDQPLEATVAEALGQDASMA